MTKACKDCKHFKGDIKSTLHSCTAPGNMMSYVGTGGTYPWKTPEILRSAWNVVEEDDTCGPEGKWWIARG